MIKRILPMIKRILPMKIDNNFTKEKHIDYDNLNILFYGPANSEEKNNLDINSYDIVFITNNMINIFFNKYINIKPKIILLSNQYFSLHNSNEIEKYANHIFLIYVISKKSIKSLKNKKINIPILLIKNNSKFKIMKTPLGLTRVLMLLEDKNYKSLNIIGCTFYNNTNTIYEKNYQRVNQIEDLKTKHNLDSNIEYLKYFMTKKKINISIELSNILSLYEVEVEKNEGAPSGV